VYLCSKCFYMSLAEKEALLVRIDTALDDIRPHLAVDGGK